MTDKHTTPLQITLTLELPHRGGARVEEKLAGVYEIDGDWLKICVVPAEKPATDFTTQPNSGRRL